MTHNSWALVTGATAGIGKEFVELLATKNYNLVLVARDARRMTAQAADLQARFPNIKTEVLSADLAIRDQLKKVEDRVRSSDNAIDVLINNAGFALNQKFSTGDLEQEQYLLDVLVGAVLRLSHAALSSMKVRGHGDVIIVSSVASFIAGGTYSAAKAWATVFAESMSQELVGSGVMISALCPGYTHTEFHDRAKISKSGVPAWLWLDARKLVAAGWRDHQRGVIVSVPSWQYKLLTGLTKILPRSVVRNFGFRARNKRRG